MSLALSTSWNTYRFNSGSKLLFEIKKLGFRAVELSFNLDQRMVEEILEQARKLEIAITSLHNYCPIPENLRRQEALPDCYSLAAVNEEERSKAVKYTKLTIDTAQRAEASVVVLHCGRVEIPDFTRQLINLYNQGLKEDASFLLLRAKMVQDRITRAADFLAQAINSLDELNAYAKDKGILLGIETRFYHNEIPNISEIGIILNKFPDSQIFYWHDTGHAQVTENLGLAKHKAYLDFYGKSLIGVHLHDILGCQDHRAPLTGNLDFNLLQPYLKAETIKVIEAHYPATSAALVKSRNFIAKLYNEK